ncbi:SDR family oxidoreductase [Corallococcus praedator]|uniref:SDR family oxidoreductase n=1 Tax=Corallococcus praedator TaxID=2316724 RepID=A0ABX9QE49_9BACT|nr:MULTISPECIES: SDR family oxidoreductase [Corallococcus]RKH32937.1 SDR family oxidoreductase [Corallococcus sp. CA031C]RKI02672.1 SDR family oxidoreductase [Corallococcus praedator]
MATQHDRLDGKVCLITGATGGIGQETAKALARLGATLVLSGRDEARTAATVAAVREAAPQARVESLLADLSSLASVRALAQAFRERHQRLDILINNAGLIIDRRQVTVDGYEATFATNHLSHFLLTHLLRDLLVASGPARIINVSSFGHAFASADFLDDPQTANQPYRPIQVYGNAKLSNILFTKALAKRLAGTQVTANALHPGAVRTGFGHNSQGIFRHLVKLGAPFMISPEKGARTSVYLAASPEVAGVSGEYFNKCRKAKPSSAARDEALAERLWQVSEQLTGVKA